MPEELVQTGIVATEVVATGPSGRVDEPPVVSVELQAEIDRLILEKQELEKAAEEAKEKAVYWRKEKARERDEYFKGRGKEREAPIEEKPSTPELRPKPKRDDFEDYDTYVESLTEWKADEKIAKWRQEESANKIKEARDQKITSLQEKLNQGYGLYSDFEEVIRDPSVPITMVMRDILAEIDRPAEVAYYLAKNRLETIKIANLSPFAAHKEILRIEAGLPPPGKNNPPADKLVSGAPPPIKPSVSSSSTTKDISKMTQKEYEAYAKERGMRPY